MSASAAVQGIQGRIVQRIDAVKTAFNGHVNVTLDAIKTIASGKGVSDLLALKPVQSAADVTKDVSDGIFDKLIGGNIDVTVQHAKRQAEITRQGRVS